MSKEERLEFLDEERKKIWEKIVLLEESVGKKTSDYENEAKLSSQQALTFKITSEEAKTNIVLNLEEANSKLQKIKAAYTAFEEFDTKIKEFFTASEENSTSLKRIFDSIEKKSESIQNQIAEIEKIFESKPILDEKIIKLGEIYTRGDDYDTKLNALYKSITERKKEVDELYYQIIGYTDTDKETGVETKVKGKKEELEESFTLIKSKLDELAIEFTDLKNNTELNYTKFIQDRSAAFLFRMDAWQDSYTKVEKTLEDLLPRALTTGLSYAYSEKKLTEVEERKRLSRTFYIAIGGLIIVSLIPFGISIKSIFDKTDFQEVIFRIPRLVLAILPLYIPVLWVAYSANRKMNLSKRLIEEYSHKEVLSKTFEGLSKQINNIEDKDISSDLRIKLLYNILEVNSENPGKLISDYNKSDHPLMDALDKSVKLTNAVTRLAKIPGFSKMATMLERKSQEILKEEGQKADAGLETLTVEKIKSNGDASLKS